MSQHHLDDATLMSYAAGTLGEALSLVAASHLDICRDCRAELTQMELIGAALMGEVKAEPVSVCGERGAFARLEAGGGSAVLATTEGRADATAASADMDGKPGSGSGDGVAMPAPLARLVGGDYDTIAWKRLAPGVRHYRLPLSKGASGDVRLLRIEPGRQIPEHGHGGSELTLVLTGSYSDETGDYRAGDVADLDVDTEHQPVVGKDGECICLVASDQKARFKGLVSRILQPLIGM